MLQAIFDEFKNSNEYECIPIELKILHKNIEPFLQKNVTIAIVSMCSNVKGFNEGKLWIEDWSQLKFC